MIITIQHTEDQLSPRIFLPGPADFIICSLRLEHQLDPPQKKGKKVIEQLLSLCIYIYIYVYYI